MRSASDPADRGSLTIFTDGAARGNPGPAAIGVLAVEGGRPVFTISRYVGFATNNVAEYLAVIAGLEKAASLSPARVTVMMDSELIQRQLSGAYKVRNPRLKDLYARTVEAARAFKRCDFVHVRREGNAEADKLANEALDEALRNRGE